jgi:hypothetical protein
MYHLQGKTMKESFGVIFFIVLAITLATFSLNVASYPMQQDPNDGSLQLQGNSNDMVVGNDQLPLMENNRAMRLYLLSWLQNLGALQNERIRTKKTCLINAGLSHSCDYKDALNAIAEGKYLGSENTPGKK